MIGSGHNNRSLIFNRETPSLQGPDTNSRVLVESPTESSQSGYENRSNTNRTPTTWVAKRDRHMQLINSSIFNKGTSEPVVASQPTRTTQRNSVGKTTVIQSPSAASNFSAIPHRLELKDAQRPGTKKLKFSDGHFSRSQHSTNFRTGFRMTTR